jgi:glutamate-5-semialdehyde dehydrogenase
MSFSEVQKASRKLNLISADEINEILIDAAKGILANADKLLTANKKDLDKMDPADPKYDRLLLNNERLEGIAQDMRNVASLDNPLDKTLDSKKLENGLKLNKVSVPLGVVGIIYEARPNVTFDVFALCFKSGNACVLKGGSDAINSNTAAAEIIHDVLNKYGVDINCVYLLPAGREKAEEMMQADEYIDVIIPRGSQNLINHVRENSKIPVIETGAGIVHTYFDKDGDIEKGVKIIDNAKTRRVSVCNALDCLVIHKERLNDLIKISKPLAEKGVKVFADQKAYEVLKEFYPENLLKEADEKSFGTEFLSLKMSIKTVADLSEAIEHITKYSSKHSEAIITENASTAEEFMKRIDASTVYLNTSTAYTDGAQFGLGAEIGISTQKLHARGPMSVNELTSYKWIVKGNGQIRTP